MMHGMDFKDGMREVAKGLTNLGQSIEASADKLVEQQREKRDVGQEIVRNLTEAIEKAAAEIQALRESEAA